jgi:DNA-directed RNA polymerase subunit beta
MALAEARPVSLALANGAARHSFARISEVTPIPNLIKVQRDSFEWFLREGLKELFAEISPIQDFTGRNMDLELAVPGPDGEPGYSFGLPKMTEDECREHDVTFAAPLKVRMRLKIKSGENAGEIKEQDIFMGDFPLMTDQGTFIINGAERVVVSQLVRSPGVYFTTEEDPTSGRDLCMGKLIPSRGAWLEFETSNKCVLSTKVDRKRKIPITTLLRAVAAVSPGSPLGEGTDDELRALFAQDDDNADHKYIDTTIDRDPTHTSGEALLEFYRRLREAHLTNQYANHKFCGQCPDWASTRWPHQGRSYADMVQEFIEEA